jgi:hypothetical protein
MTGWRRRQLSHGTPNVCLRAQSCDDFFHLAFAPMASSQEQLFAIALRQVRCKQSGVGHRDESLFEMKDQRWQTACRTRDFDAPKCGVLGEVQHLRAERKQRRVSVREVQAPRVDLPQASNQRCRCEPFLSRQLQDFGAQFVVGEVGEVRHIRL